MLGVADAPKKTGGKRGRPPSDRPLRNHVGVKLPDDLAQALDAYLHSLDVEPGSPAVMRTALEEFLEQRGFWPPPTEDQSEAS